MHNTIAFLPNSHPHPLVVYPVLTNEEKTTESQRHNSFTRDWGNANPKHVGPGAKVSNPTAGLTLLWARNPSREILTTGKSHGKKLDRFSLNDNMDVEKVSRFKYATWNIRGPGEKEELHLIINSLFFNRAIFNYYIPTNCTNLLFIYKQHIKKFVLFKLLKLLLHVSVTDWPSSWRYNISLNFSY